MAPNMVVPAIPILLPGRLVAPVMTPRRPPTVQRCTMGCSLAVPPIKIPPPPLGRLVFNTFPAIYKDKPKTQARTGQIFPRGNR